MKLPYKENVVIKREKLVDYLLSLNHPIGKYKAAYFRKMGFDYTNIELFKKELFLIAQHNNVESQKFSENDSGINYKIVGTIHAPDGNSYRLITSWYIKTGSQKPSFVTAYPV